MHLRVYAERYTNKNPPKIGNDIKQYQKESIRMKKNTYTVVYDL